MRFISTFSKFTCSGILLIMCMPVVWAAQFNITTIAMTGDTLPGGGNLSLILRPSVNSQGEVAFFGVVTNSFDTRVMVKYSGGSLTEIARAGPGQTAPGTGGGIFAGFSNPSISDSGQVSFYANMSGGSSGSGIFVDTAGTVAARALGGALAPLLPGDTDADNVWSSFGDRPRINSSGDLIFSGSTADPNGSPDGKTGVFVDAGGGGFSTIAAVTETAPGTGGGTFATLGNADINNNGDVVFNASVIGGSSSEGLFTSSGGGAAPTNLVLQGDSAPGTGGGTFTDFFRDPAINDQGNIAFNGGFVPSVGPLNNRGMFLVESGTVSAIALEGDPVPELGPFVTHNNFAFSRPPSLGGNKDVVFNSKGIGIFTSLNGGAPSLLAQAGDAIPDQLGVTFTSLAVDGPSAFSANGDFVFFGTTSGAGNPGGIFYATEIVPLPAAIWLFGSGLLGLIGLGRSRRNN